VYFRIKIKNIIALIAYLLLAANGFAQSPKGEYGTFALTNATIETITKGSIVNGTVVVSNGKITAVGTDVTIPQGAKVIDCRGMWIYPGMIDGGTQLGLS
jgi:imidazolonepropionase-like amidohydrolase